ncbi:MAG: succinylglutamate desuccinylase/aspartoacylase family protein [bacterium]
MKYEPIVKIISGALSGPTVVICAGVHGDEPVGVLALKNVLPNLKLLRGTLVTVMANPPALAAGERFLDENLNRALTPSASSDTIEGQLALSLMPILDSADALLDIHAGMGGEPPFIICEENGFEIARRMPVSILSTGWVKAEPGSTDEYMYRQGKPAICIECGDRAEAEKMTPLAVEAIRQLLAYFGMIDGVEPGTVQQRVVAVKYPVFKKSEQFRFTRKFRGFQALKPGERIATDGAEQYCAPDYPSCIIFPWQEAPVGAEAFLVAESTDMVR